MAEGDALSYCPVTIVPESKLSHMATVHYGFVPKLSHHGGKTNKTTITMKDLKKQLLLLLCAVVGCGAAWAQESNVAWVKVTDYTNLSTNDTYVIAGCGISGGVTTWYSLKNNQVTSATTLPIGSVLTISDGMIKSKVSPDETWTLELVTGTTDVYYIISTKGDYYLEATSSTPSYIRSKQDNENNKWKIHYTDSYTNSNNITRTVTGLYLPYVHNGREMAVFDNGSVHEWRSYGPEKYNNIDQEEVVLYRKVITSATIGAAEYATFSCPAALDFSAETGLTIYTVTVNADETEVTLTEVTNKQVPANTAVVLHGASGTYTGQVMASATPINNNHLKIAESEMSGAAGNIYVLNKKNGVVGFYKLSSTGTLAAGKAYLQLTNPAPMLTMTEEETTGVLSLTPTISQGEGECYDLSGRRVSQPKNGLYIVNGRKVVVK